MKIMLSMLEKRRACEDQREVFARLFPNGVRVTRALCLEHAQDFSWDWAADHLLTKEKRAEYKKIVARAGAKYDKIRSLAWVECEKIRSLAWAEYERIVGPARVECEKITGRAWAEYERIVGPAWAKDEKAQALAFYEASK